MPSIRSCRSYPDHMPASCQTGVGQLVARIAVPLAGMVLGAGLAVAGCWLAWPRAGERPERARWARQIL